MLDPMNRVDVVEGRLALSDGIGEANDNNLF